MGATNTNNIFRFRIIAIGAILFHFIIVYELRSVSAERIILFDGHNAEGESLELNIDRCTVMPRGWNDRASSAQTFGNCFELFDNKHCTGKSIRLDQRRGQRNRPTNLNDFEFDDIVGSVEPCARLSPSHTTAYFGSRTAFTIVLYELVGHSGQSAEVRIDGCSNIAPPLQKNVASVDTKGKCVKLYDQFDCEGNDIDIRPNDPNSINLHFLEFIDKAVSAGPCFQLCLGGRVL